MANLKPKMTAVHDGQGRMAVYIDESVGQDAIVSRFAPRYQRIVIRGEPCTIFFDKNARSFYIGPVFYKQELMDRPGRYEHITDLNWLPPDGAAPPAGAAIPAVPAGATVPAGAAGSGGGTGTGGAMALVEGDDERNEGYNEVEEMDLDGQAPATTGSPQITEKIPRPPNSWILFRKQKSKELHEANPGMSAGEISTEASRQWKNLSDEDRGFFQEMAKEAAQQHKIQYPDYRYKPARK